MLIKPKIIQIKDIDDIELKYQISRIPAIHFIDILKIYPLNSKNIPKIPKIDNKTLLSLLKYVSFYDDTSYIILDNEDKINKYINDTETLLILETQLILYNIEFMRTRKKCRLYNATDELPYKYVNIDSGVASIITNKFATLHELSTIYDYEDYSNMLEIIQVNISNEIYAKNKASKKK